MLPLKWREAMGRQPALVWALTLAVVARLAVFCFAVAHPFISEGGTLVSPLEMQRGMDIGFYLGSKAYYGQLTENLTKSYHSLVNEGRQGGPFYLTGPIFPSLLAVSDYREGHTLPLAIFFLLLSCALVSAWLVWLHRQGLSAGWLTLFAVMPNPIWFTINISTDLVFSALFAVFFFVYFSTIQETRRWQYASLLVVLMLLTRPNALSLLLFVVAESFLNRRQNQVTAWLVLALVLLSGIAAAFYLPYFLAFLDASGQIPYFGIRQTEYLQGIFPNLPLIGKPLSWLALAAAKALYFCGLRPSYATTSPMLVAARAAGGLVLLPGLVYALVAGGRSVRLLILLLSMPLFVGATQERYNLPYQPVLFFYGALAYRLLWSYCQRALKSGSGNS